jgi:hypothetical protein
MNMTKISTLLTSIALASTPIFAQAYQIGPNPNPVGNTIDVLGSDAEASNFTNFGVLHIGNRGILEIDRPDDGIGLDNQLGGTLNVDIGGTLAGDNMALYNNGTLNNSGALTLSGGELRNKSDGIINNSGTMDIFSSINYGTLSNNLGGTINVYGFPGLINYGTINNYDKLSVSGDLYNTAGATFVNHGIMNNTDNVGNIINELDGTVTNNGTIDLHFFTNFGTINGSGNINIGWTGFWNFNYGNINQASFHVNQGGLGGNGTFTGDTTIDREATISPTEISSPISTLTFNGEFHSSGTLNIDISGTEIGQYDALVINGSADFTGGNILFNFTDGFRPSVGDHWNFLLADNIAGLDSLNVGFSGLHYSEITGYLTIDSLGGHLEITTAVPEPETYAMLLAGLGLLGFVAHRRKTITI